MQRSVVPWSLATNLSLPSYVKLLLLTIPLARGIVGEVWELYLKLHSMILIFQYSIRLKILDSMRIRLHIDK